MSNEQKYETAIEKQVEEKATAFKDVTVVGKNITPEEVIPGIQSAITYIVDVSGSIHNRGLETIVRDALGLCKDTIKKSKGSIQVSMVRFGDKVEMQAFQYVDNIDFSYKAAAGATKLYDAVLAGITNHFDQIEKMEVPYDVTGGIIIVTDGSDTSSKPENRKKSIDGIKSLLNETNSKVVFILLGEEKDFPELVAYCNECGVPAVKLTDDHQLRRALGLLTETFSDVSDEIEDIESAEQLTELIAEDVSNEDA